MYECLIEEYKDDVKYYKYYMNEHGAIPKTPHVKIPEGAEYLILHERTEEKQLIFYKDNFNWMWSISYDETDWCDCNWGDVTGNKLEYMKHVYDSVVLWKREEEMKNIYPDDVLAVTESKSTKLWWYDNGMVSKPNDNLYNPWHITYKQYLTDVPYTKLIYKREDKPVNEDKYLLTKLQACDVILSRTSVLQYLSTGGSWVDFESTEKTNNAVLYTILFNLDDTKFRIKPESDHESIEFCEVMDMLSEGKYKEVYVNKRQTLDLLNNSMRYLAKEYHDSYSKLIQNNITYDQWKSCKKGEENV